MKKILVNQPIHPDALRLLQESEFEILYPIDQSDAEALALLPEVEGMVLFVGVQMTGALMDRCPRLEVIGRHGVGLDNVDVPAATARGIQVVYTPYGPTESTAEHTFTLMMALARRLVEIDQATRANDFDIRDRIITREMQGKAVGIAGFGRIGKRFGQMCKAALDMTVYVYDPYLEKSFVESLGAVYMTDLKQMAAKVDVLSVHTPLTAETRHMINREVFAAMQPGAYFINASRGAVVSQPDLVAALQAGQIAGAALDVYEPEPPGAVNPLYQMKNVILTPHLASMTVEGKRRMGVTVAEEVLKALRGQTPTYIANPEVLQALKNR